MQKGTRIALRIGIDRSCKRITKMIWGLCCLSDCVSILHLHEAVHLHRGVPIFFTLNNLVLWMNEIACRAVRHAIRVAKVSIKATQTHARNSYGYMGFSPAHTMQEILLTPVFPKPIDQQGISGIRENIYVVQFSRCSALHPTPSINFCTVQGAPLGVRSKSE